MKIYDPFYYNLQQHIKDTRFPGLNMRETGFIEVYNERTIQHAINLWLRTGRRYKFYDPSFGTAIPKQLWMTNPGAIKGEIESSLERLDKRIRLLNVEIIRNNQNSYSYNVIYNFLGTKYTANVSSDTGQVSHSMFS